MRVVILGATKYSRTIFEALLAAGVNVVGVMAIPEEFIISYSEEPVQNYNYAPLDDLCEKLHIPHYVVDGKKQRRLSNYKSDVASLSPDILLVIGWYYMIPSHFRDIATYGAWGIHASLLPKYAGGAPLVWAIINGETKTGVTLFKLEDGVDNGDIICQKSISIEPDDYIADVYQKATTSSIGMLKEVLLNDKPPSFTPQNQNEIEIHPQRSPDDGLINLNLPSTDLYNFIRAQSAPYPGAFIKTVDGKKLIIEKCRIE